MDEDKLANVITLVFTFFVVFLGVYLFSLTNAPFLFLLYSIASFGYILVLLALFQKANRKSYLLFLIIGIVLILLCIFITYASQAKPSIF